MLWLFKVGHLPQADFKLNKPWSVLEYHRIPSDRFATYRSETRPCVEHGATRVSEMLKAKPKCQRVEPLARRSAFRPRPALRVVTPDRLLDTECRHRELVGSPMCSSIQPREARADIVEYITMFYNSHRLHSYLGYQSPDQFEKSGRLASAA
jgi:transposase InsO family protein